MKRFQLLLSIVLAVAFLATGITGVSAATMATSGQLAAIKDAVDQQGDIKGVMQGLVADSAASLMEQGYTPEEFQAAMATMMGELISAIPADAENYASLVEQAFSGSKLGVVTGVAEATGANPALDQATYEVSAQEGLVLAAQEASDTNPDLDVSTLMSAIGDDDIEEPEAFEPAEQAPPGIAPPAATMFETRTAVETPPTQDTTASPI